MKPADAMQGLSTGNRTGKPAERKQEILTPPSIVAVCTKVWKRIHLDPCWCEGAITNPARVLVDPEGLKAPWSLFTFINPPFKDLKQWLIYGLTQPSEQIWLVPVRTHRKWWRQWRDQLDMYVELDPLKFLMYEQCFPAPLLLGYRGELRYDFCMAAQSLGGVYFKR